MEVRVRKRVKTIQGNTCEQYNTNYNSFMDELAETKAKILNEHISQFKEYSIDIFYEIKETVCENVRDEYVAQGYKYYCNDCPYLDRSTDGRKKIMPCPYHELGRTNITNEACLKFYEDMRNGKIKPLWE